MLAHLLGLAGTAVLGPAAAHEAPGPLLPPLPLPALPLLLDDGSSTDLRSLLLGRVTAVQFVLTQCSAICPLLGALFMQTQTKLMQRPPSAVQLLSISLDPIGDSPQAMARWLQKQGVQTQPAWRGAVPRADQSSALETLRSLGGGPTQRDQHSAQVFLVDRQARLVFRSDDLPDATWLLRGLTTLSRNA